MDKVNADSPRVRAAARAAWMAYITGPPPPPAPKKKLQLPGGKLTKKEKPLWLTYRELADNELRKAANELLARGLPARGSDARRPRRRAGSKKKTVKVDLEDADQAAVRVLRRASAPSTRASSGPRRRRRPTRATSPARPRCSIACSPPNPDARRARARWRRSTSQCGKQLEGKQQWADAAAAYSKAHGPRSEGRERDRRARRASLHARQGARGAGQGRRPRLPHARSRSSPTTRRRRPPRARRRAREPAGLDAVRRRARARSVALGLFAAAMRAMVRRRA